MTFPIKLVTSDGNLRQFEVADVLNIDAIDVRGTGDMLIGASMGASDELKLGSATSDVRVLGDFFVDGSEIVSTDETITGVFTANGNVNLGDNSGDIINLGGGTTDTVNLLADLEPGLGVVGLGTGLTEYFDEIWLIAVNDNGPDAAAYNLVASGTNAGAYSIGVDPAIIANSASTDLMTMLDDLDAAISAAGADTLQTAYAAGNTIAVTTANGIVSLANNTNSDTTTVLEVGRTPGSSTAGIALQVTMGANATGTGLEIDNAGSGNAIDVQDGGTSVLVVSGAGAATITPTSGQNLTATVAGAGVIDFNAAGAITLDSTGAGISLDAAGASNFSTSSGNLTFDAAAGELTFDDVGNSGLELSQTGDRTLEQTASGEILEGATSIIGAFNAIARFIDVEGGITLEKPITNGVTMAAGDVVAATTTNDRVTQANANANTNGRLIGICLVGGTGDVGGTVLARIALPGSYVTDSGASFTAGDALFMPDGTGRVTGTAPANAGDLVQRVGWAVNATTFVIDPGPPVIL